MISSRLFLSAALILSGWGVIVAGDTIRTIKAYTNFRPIFIVSERTFTEHSKDVSRALRNRCQEIWFNFKQEPNNDFADESVRKALVLGSCAKWQTMEL